MTDLMRALYEYTCKNEVKKYLPAGEYEEAQAAIKMHLKKLEKQFAGVPFEDLLGELDLNHSLELEAMFEATVALCRQLRGSLG